MRYFVVFLVQIFIVFVNSDHKEDVKNKNALPYFRREIDLNLGDNNLEGALTQDPQSNLVSVLVNNVKEVFQDINYPMESDASSTANAIFSDETEATIKIMIKSMEGNPNLTDEVMNYVNNTLTNYQKSGTVTTSYEKNMAKTRTLMLQANEMKSMEKLDRNLKNSNISVMSPLHKDTVDPIGLHSHFTRSCISCNNVMYEECNDPKHNLIPSAVCERDSDVCYSQHTPFGIVDRGCFNVHYNLTTYVCSCNLCNYISISEMPYIFSNKQDWLDNFVELTRTRNFRKSVFKDMACMQCEVKTTNNIGDMLYSSNCLEGNIGSVPTTICEENEICGVKAIKRLGYIWRGCVRAPLFNYLWAFCDSDLCNYDSLVSVYDLV